SSRASLLAMSPFPSALRTARSEITPTYSSAGVRVSHGMCSGGEPTGTGRARRTSCLPPAFAAHKEVGGLLSGASANPAVISRQKLALGMARCYQLPSYGVLGEDACTSEWIVGKQEVERRRNVLSAQLPICA